MAAEIAEPLSRCGKITMVSHGDGELGAKKITNEILDILHKVHSTMETLAFQTDDEDDVS